MPGRLDTGTFETGEHRSRRSYALESMRGLLCGEFLEFAAGHLDWSPDGPTAPSCSRDACPGPRHLRVWVDLVARESGVPAPVLLELFGAALFGRLARAYPAFLVGVDSTTDLVARFDGYVGAELRKLDPAARPPSLALVARRGRGFDVVYRSPAGLADLAAGLLRGSVAHFGEALDVERGAAGPRRVTFRLAPRRSAGPRPRSRAIRRRAASFSRDCPER